MLARMSLIPLVSMSFAGCLGYENRTNTEPITEEPPLRVVCEDTGIPDRIEMPLGGRSLLKLSPDSKAVGFEVAVITGDFFAGKVSDREWRVKAGLTQTTGTLQLRLRCAENQSTRNIEVKTRAPRWNRLHSWTDGDLSFPKNREYAATILVGRRFYVHGGFWYRPTQFTVANDTWMFDLDTNTWTGLPQSIGAPAFGGGAFVHFPDGKRLATLGGIDANNSPRWHFDALDVEQATWSSVTVKNAPTSGAYQAGLVFDSRRGRYLHVCGQTSTGVNCRVASLSFDDTGNVEWKNEALAAGETPTPRVGFAHAYDAENDRVIVYAGNISQQGKTIGDTWALELSETPIRWVRLTADAPEHRRRNGAFALDEANHRLVVWGGTPDGRNTTEGLWFLDLDRGEEAWARVEVPKEVPPRTSATAVYDAKGKRLIVGFGNSIVGQYPDTWEVSF